MSKAEKRDDTRDEARLICATISLAAKATKRMQGAGSEQERALRECLSSLCEARFQVQEFIRLREEMP